jgi:hypothetical protein
MGETFRKARAILGREKRRTRNTHRADGTRETQTQIVLRERRGVQSIIYVKFFFDHRDRVVLSQEAALSDGEDTKIERVTWRHDEAGNATEAWTDTIYLARQGGTQKPLFDSPDVALNRLLQSYGHDVSQFGAPRAAPQLSFTRSKEAPTDWERFITRATHKALIKPEE